jgi:hypothetical protein
MERIRQEALFDQACGVVADRLNVNVETAGHIIDHVARRQAVSRAEVAADVVASCTDSRVFLPRELLTNGYGYESAA